MWKEKKSVEILIYISTEHFLFNDTLTKNNREKQEEEEKNDERVRGRMFLSLLLLAKSDFSFIVCIRPYLLSHINMIIYAW
jgi:hypothetical protein